MASFTSTMCPLDMRPPLAREWIRVSSRSMTRVFWVSFEGERFVDREYEGWRRGTRGRGGAGARGYLVIRREDAGDVGDLMVAAVTGGWFSGLGVSALLVGFFGIFFVLRRRPVSSFRTFMRIERLGASSSEDDACCFGRLTDIVLLACPFSPTSVSVSEAIAEEIESAASDLRRLILMVVFRRPLRSSLLVDMVAWGDAESPTACAVDLRPLRLGRALPSLRTGANGEKRPSSS